MVAQTRVARSGKRSMEEKDLPWHSTPGVHLKIKECKTSN